MRSCGHCQVTSLSTRQTSDHPCRLGSTHSRSSNTTPACTGAEDTSCAYILLWGQRTQTMWVCNKHPLFTMPMCYSRNNSCRKQPWATRVERLNQSKQPDSRGGDSWVGHSGEMEQIPFAHLRFSSFPPCCFVCPHYSWYELFKNERFVKFNIKHWFTLLSKQKDKF